ncbi:hypothetical protein [Plebeiibacterium marinum]|uniref:Uncharacterized protein n=1 Tax=Plebeiibacterium marinum TaxID=2992111 RepID=A0AAE3MI17_9BACT|nr:hypothetical protein [Plebeiobacterium marinum]MCW3808032.1 hypothetical protein [Plebeiobacterium marinum]
MFNYDPITTLSVILIQSEEEVNLKKEIAGHIIKQVVKEGRALRIQLLSECTDIDVDFANIDPKELSDFGVDARCP